MANPNPVGRRRSGVPNKVNTARVQRVLAEGKRLPLEFAAASASRNGGS
jgi:hypothetical protein